VLAAQRAAGARGRVRHRQLRGLDRSLRSLRIWAREGPDFVHMARALAAERARVRGQPRAALAHYAQAIERAGAQGYVHHAAFLHERRAGLLSELRRDTEAAAALRQAIGLYEEWGARGKAQSLRRVRSAL
jgi:predicted RNA polymerase sigma factor